MSTMTGLRSSSPGQSTRASSGSRVGLEDTLIARDGGPAPANAAQVAATVKERNG